MITLSTFEDNLCVAPSLSQALEMGLSYLFYAINYIEILFMVVLAFE